MGSFSLMTKEFIKNKFLSIFSCFFLFSTIGYLIYSIILCYQQSSNPLDYLSQTLRFSIFLFVFFMFIANEYLYKITQCDIAETLQATKKGYRSFYFYGFSVLTFILFLYTLILLLINIGIYVFLDVGSQEYLLHIVNNILFNIFFVPLIGILFGGIMSFIKSRIAAYLLMIAMVFLSSPAFDLISTTVYAGTGVSVFEINDFFNIFPPLLEWSPISTFGYSLLPYRIELSMFFFFFYTGILCLLIFNKRQKKLKSLSLISLALCIICLIGYFQPSSKVTMSQNPKIGVFADVFYYKNVSVDENEPNFSVNKYKIDLGINKQLEVQATLFLNENDLKDYTFTLYHGYIIKEITNQLDEPLEFTQDGDYFTVNSENSLNIVKIRYSGSSPKYFSNNQGVCLPGSFAYYPHPGKLKMFDLSQNSFERILCPKGTEFSVNIQSSRKTYCNLDESGSHSYSGTSNALTLVSGFYKTVVCDDIEVVYPYLEMSEFSPNSIETFVKQYKEANIFESKHSKVFVLPNTNDSSVYARFCGMDDHVILQQFLGLSMIYEMQKVPSYKLSVYSAYNYYKKNAKAFYDMAAMRKEIQQETGSKSQDMYILLDEKLKEFKAEYVEKSIETYLADEFDKRESFDFINELRGD